MPSSLSQQLALHDTQNAQQNVISAPALVTHSVQGDVAVLPTPPPMGTTEPRVAPLYQEAFGSFAPLSPLSDDRSPSPSSTPSVDGDALTHPTPSICRRNEHLAVLIPRNLWKADRLASHCDRYACRVKFTLFERKHHCRKCGGIYCHSCSARTTPLLDTTKLPFLLPPRGFPVSHFAAPHAPVIDARVCDDCHNQIHGTPIVRARTAPSSPKALASVPSTSSVSTLSPSTPPDGRSLPEYPNARQYCYYWAPPPPVHTTKLDGPLDRYPLKDPSHTCKLAGTGRWEPKPYYPRWDGRLADGRLWYEAEAQREEEEERQRTANPVIVELGGEIRVRRPPAQNQNGTRRSYTLPTF
ncbi:FYVE zinc finger-domain-containing protein [Hysterangium stoloniferum]|nr:FYVE zinc finger-domain-containing protein [Hysterangium stoloniferum]